MITRWQSDREHRPPPIGEQLAPTSAGDISADGAAFSSGFMLTAAATHARQVVFLGSALDARPYELHWPSDANIYVVDAPSNIEVLSNAATHLGITPTATVITVSTDLSTDEWPDLLVAAGFDVTVPSMWNVEGWMPYLPEVQRDQLLRAVTRLSAPTSSLITQAEDAHPYPDVSEFWRRRGWTTGPMLVVADSDVAPQTLISLLTATRAQTWDADAASVKTVTEKAEAGLHVRGGRHRRDRSGLTFTSHAERATST